MPSAELRIRTSEFILGGARSKPDYKFTTVVVAICDVFMNDNRPAATPIINTLLRFLTCDVGRGDSKTAAVCHIRE